MEFREEVAHLKSCAGCSEPCVRSLNWKGKIKIPGNGIHSMDFQKRVELMHNALFSTPFFLNFYLECVNNSLNLTSIVLINVEQL